MNAKLLGTYKGKRVFRFPVKITCGETAALLQVNYYPREVVQVVANTAREARDWVADQIQHIPCCEVEVTGPKGGRASYCYWGWDRAIFSQMLREQTRQEREAAQMRLPLVVPQIRKQAA